MEPFLDTINSVASTSIEFDNIVWSLTSKPATISLIKNITLWFLEIWGLSFKLVGLVTSTGNPNLSIIKELTEDQWQQMKDVFIYVILNFNLIAKKFREGQQKDVASELIPYEAEFLSLSSRHLDIKQSFVGVSQNLTEMLGIILRLIATNLTNPKNHFTGQNMK